MLHFIQPSAFNNVRQFTQWFDHPFDDDDKVDSYVTHRKSKRLRCVSITTEEKELMISSIHKILFPFLLRRVKSDVHVGIPPKVEKLVICPLSYVQKTMYRQLLMKINRAVDVIGSDQSLFMEKVSCINASMQIRKLLNHPFILLDEISHIPDDLYYSTLIASSGKLCILERILKILMMNKHKCLIFSQFTQTLNVLEHFLNGLEILYCRLDGNIQRTELLHDLR